MTAKKKTKPIADRRAAVMARSLPDEPQMTQEPRKPKVMIGVPSGSTWHADMAMSMIALATTSMQNGIALCFASQRGSHISKQRNDMVEHAMAMGADYILQVDSDMMFPPDALVQLLKHDKDIVGATYNKRVPPYETLGKMEGPAPAGPLTGGLIQALFMPGGFMLTKMSVFNKVPYPWYAEQYDVLRYSDKCLSEDYYFCEKARQHGFAIACDISLTTKMGHIGEQVVTCLAPQTAPSPEASGVIPYGQP